MKICIIGSSHIGSLKLGWDMVRDQFPEHQLVFFGSQGSTLRHLRAKGGRLVSTDSETTKSLAYTSGGLQEIDLDRYDAIILYGLVLKMPRLKRGLSRAVMQETVKNIAETGLAIKIASRARKITDKPFWMAANPLQLAPDGQHDPGRFYDPADLLAEFQRVFPVSGITFLGQPSETICRDLRTAAQFGVGSVRLMPDGSGDDREHRDGEVKHMNGDYGRLWLLQNLPLVALGAVA